MSNYLKTFILWLVVVVLYVLAAKWALSLAFEQVNISPVWPPTGIAIAVLLRFGIRHWPSIFVGAFIVNYLTGLTIGVTIGIAMGNSIEAMFACYFIQKYIGCYPFNTVINVARFLIIVLIATMISAMFGVFSLLAANVITWSEFAILFSTGWLGDWIGGIILIPFLLTWSRMPNLAKLSKYWLVALLLSVVTVLCLVLVFGRSFSYAELHYPLAFIFLPTAIITGYYFHHYGTTLFSLLLAIVTVYGTFNGVGPFVVPSMNESLLLLQSFIGIITITSLTLSASLIERQQANEDSMQVRRELEQIVVQQTGDLKTAAHELRLAECVFNESVESIFITDKSGAILRVNPAFCRLTGYSPREAIGRNPRFLQSGKHNRRFYRDFWQQLLAEHSWQGEVWDKRKNGEIFPVWQTVTAVKNKQDDIVQFISIFSDISQRKITEDRIYHLAHFDALTGLRNRNAFYEQLQKDIHHAQRHRLQLAILYLDLDHFKLINDASGHSVGDLLLKQMARRINAVIRDEDTIARLGGDEFVILLNDINGEQDAGMVAEKLLSVLNTPMLLGDIELVVTCSVGISIYPDNGETADTLLCNADVAMYRAKDKGRNTYQYFTQEMNEQAQERLLLLNDLRKALANNEFVLNYQPQVNIKTGTIIGVEALIRWHHPTRGLILPNIFIPLAEESGLIKEIGAWVLRTACLQQQQWQQQNLPMLLMAVNISSKEFLNQHLLTQIKSTLAETGADPSYLSLELTESIIMENVEETIGILTKMKAMGLQLAIDDFGTGYSSMAYLKRFPIDKLKIDQSFIRDVSNDACDAAIINAIIVLGHNLYMTVIAEGVETKAQLQFLTVNECDEIQGYYFSKPLLADELARLVSQQANLYEIAPQ